MGYLVSQYRPSPRLVWTAATAGMALGLAVALIDHHEAVATEELGKAAARIATDSNTNTIGAKSRTWFSGTWAFQHYAMRQGMMPLDPGISELRTGDVLILANQQVNRIDFRPDLAPLERVETVTIQDKLPWHTLVCYYCGATPVKHHKGPRLSLTVYRVLADFVPMAQGNLPGM
jgi:hypothetical protein